MLENESTSFYQQSASIDEIDHRIKALQTHLQQRGEDGALILQKTDFFYFTGTIQQGWLYVPAEGAPLLMVFKDFQRAETESPIAHVLSLVSPKKIPETLHKMGYAIPKKLGMELDVLPVTLYRQYQQIFPNAEMTDISTPIRLIRAVKSDFEIDQIRASAALSDKLAAKVPELLEPGKTEIAVAGELEAYARSMGHQGLVRMRLWGSEIFYGHLMSGPSAAVPSYLASPTGGAGTSSAIGQGPGFNTIQKNEPLLVDYIFALNGYLSDMTRIFSIGPIADDLKRAHDVMVKIQDDAKTFAKPGTLSGELYERMVAQAVDAGVGENFMGAGDRKIHFTGHGVGLELDEFPFIAKGQNLPLQKGMIFALEPKMILPGKGVVGIENTFVVTDDGLTALGAFPDEICRVDRVMRKLSQRSMKCKATAHRGPTTDFK